jgi:type I restriction enzyme S subunit
MSETLRTTLGELIAEHGGSIKTGPFGTVLKAHEYSVVGVPIISVGEVGYGSFRVHESTPRAPDEVVRRLPEYVLAVGDIVFGRKGAVDRSAWVDEEQNGWFLGSDGIRVRLPKQVHSRFIGYQLQASEAREWLLQHASGSTMASLNQGILERVPLAIPPYAAQRAIAEVLGALDDKIAANTKLASTAGGLVGALFVAAVHTGELSKSTFDHIAQVGGGGTPRTGIEEYWDGDINWVTPTDVTALSGPYLETTSRRITKQGLEACASPLYPAGSILMTSRATIGAFAVAQTPTATNQGFIVVNPHDPALNWWIFHEMRSRVDEFISLANGATFLELSRGNFKKFRVRLADESTMKQFGVTADALHAQARQAFVENARLAGARDALLPMLMSGKIRVKEAAQIVGDVV